MRDQTALFEVPFGVHERNGMPKAVITTLRVVGPAWAMTWR